MSRPIRTTGQAREARRQARLTLIGWHDHALRKLRYKLMVAAASEPGGLPPAGDMAEAANHHLDRMEYHIEKLEAGQ